MKRTTLLLVTLSSMSFAAPISTASYRVSNVSTLSTILPEGISIINKYASNRGEPPALQVSESAWSFAVNHEASEVGCGSTFCGSSFTERLRAVFTVRNTTNAVIDVPFTLTYSVEGYTDVGDGPYGESHARTFISVRSGEDYKFRFSGRSANGFDNFRVDEETESFSLRVAPDEVRGIVYASLTFGAAAIPEPGTWALLASGLAALAAGARIRRRDSHHQ